MIDSRIPSRASTVAFALVAAVLAGCGGVGVILFDADNGGTHGDKGAMSQGFDVDCSDSFEANGSQTAVGSEAGTYGAACTYQGKPMAWKSLGAFHAAPMAAGNWEKYRGKVIEKASKKGCPGVAIRKAPPTKNQ